MIAGTRALFYFEHTLHDAGPELLAHAAALGFTAIITEPVRLPPWLVPAARDAGLAVLVGVACHSDHADPVLPRRPDLWPVEADGRRRARQEWYIGLIPTDPDHNAGVVRRCARLVAEGGVDGVIADFLRWPMHWELELRGPGHAESSFDPITLARFADWTGVTVPTDPAAAARAIHGAHRESWRAFRRAVVTATMARIVDAVRAARSDALVGAFIVPGTHDQRMTWLGQDVAALSEHCDVLLPMAYHAILHRPPAWIAEVTADIAGRARCPVLPVVQCTADPAVSDGADWGPEFGADEFAAALAHATTPEGGVAVFCGEGLTPDRARAVRTAFARPAGRPTREEEAARRSPSLTKDSA
ncbi:hypothetical protein GCM10023148_38420 [Actinokineospora soli]